MKKNNKIISWWSGGVTSAITCHLCIDIYGLKNEQEIEYVWEEYKGEIVSIINDKELV